MAPGKAAALLLCLAVSGASWEAVQASPELQGRQLLQSDYFMPGMSGAGGGWGRGRRRGGSGAAAACQGDAQSLLPDAENEIEQAVAKAFRECTLMPCRPEAAGVAPVSGLAAAGAGDGLEGAWCPPFACLSMTQGSPSLAVLQVIAEAVAPVLVTASIDALYYSKKPAAPATPPPLDVSGRTSWVSIARRTAWLREP